ncbi:MAG: DUF4328 domain-containing protein [Polyangiaceae bacterium]
MTTEDAAPLGSRTLKPTTTVAVLATIAISAFSFVYLIVVVLSPLMRDALPNGTEVTEETNASTVLLALFSGVVGAIRIADFILAVTTFLIWLSRVANNISVLAPDPSVPEPQDCVTCWFIPLINLIQPYRVMKALYRSVGPYQGPTPLKGSDPLSKVITVWWSAWLTGTVTSRAADRLCSSNVAGMITAGDWLERTSSVAHFIAAASVLTVLWRVEERLTAMRRANASKGAPQSTGVVYESMTLAPTDGQ